MLKRFNWILGISIAFVYYLSPDFLQEVITDAILCTIKFTCPHAHWDKHIGFNAGDFLYEFGRDQTNVNEKMKFWHKICIMPIENCKICIMHNACSDRHKREKCKFFIFLLKFQNLKQFSVKICGMRACEIYFFPHFE